MEDGNDHRESRTILSKLQTAVVGISPTSGFLLTRSARGNSLKICAHFLISIVASVLLVACGGATGSVKIITEEPLQLEPNERVALIAYITSYSPSEKLAVLTKCFIKSFNSNMGNIELVNIDLTPFQDISGNDPLGIFFTEDSTFDFCKMKSHPIFQDEILSLRLRYLILLEVADYRQDLSSGKWYVLSARTSITLFSATTSLTLNYV